MKPRRVSYQNLTEAGQNGKGGVGSEGLIFLLTTNQESGTLYGKTDRGEGARAYLHHPRGRLTPMLHQMECYPLNIL